jgi:acetyl esterase
MQALDPQIRELLEVARRAGRPRYEDGSAAQARTRFAESWALLQADAGAVESVRDVSIDCGGERLALRLYRAAETSSSERLPVVLFLHGGGFVIGNLESHDRICRSLATHARACVVAVDYRLAPESPFPAAVVDAAIALRWIHANAERICIDASRVALVGDSAGGNLAAVLAIMGRDGDVPRALFQALIYPVLEMDGCSDAALSRVDPCMPLTGEAARWFMDQYAPTPENREDWRASPSKVGSLAGLPPAFIVTMGRDVLCDVASAYARRLEFEGIPVTHLHMGDQIHGTLLLSKAVAAGGLLLDLTGSIVRHALHAHSTGHE